MPMVPIADMRMGMGNGFVAMGVRMPAGATCSHSLLLPIGMLMGMVRVLIIWTVQVLVLMPHIIMAMPVGMVLPQHQSNTANHQHA